MGPVLPADRKPNPIKRQTTFRRAAPFVFGNTKNVILSRTKLPTLPTKFPSRLSAESAKKEKLYNSRG